MLFWLVKAKNRVLGFNGAQVLGFRFRGSRQNATRYVIFAMTARLSIWPVRSSRLSL